MTEFPSKIESTSGPWTIKLYNSLLGGYKFPSLNFDSLLSAARTKTRLSDLGDDSFVDPLKHLIAAIEGEARLHAFGRFITRTRLVNLLCNGKHFFLSNQESQTIGQKHKLRHYDELLDNTGLLEAVLYRWR